jgi:plastocyanin
VYKPIHDFRDVPCSETAQTGLVLSDGAEHTGASGYLWRRLYRHGGTTPTTGTTPTPAVTATQVGNAQSVMIITNSSGSFAFSPASLTIKSGTTVTWKNTTAVPHTVTSDDGKSFDSGTANPIAAQSGTFSFTFATPGTFAYQCAIHPFMKATISVK